MLAGPHTFLYRADVTDYNEVKKKLIDRGIKAENVYGILEHNNILALELADTTWPTGGHGELQGIEVLPTMQPGCQDQWEADLQASLDEAIADVVQVNKKVNEKLLNNVRFIRRSMEERISATDKIQTQLSDKAQHLYQLEESVKLEKATLDDKIHTFEKDKENFQNELKLMEELNKIQISVVTLNVGGIKYMTSVLTLTKDPESMLAAMFSGRHVLKQEKDESYFIDRDGTQFRYILNYLRDGAALELPLDPVILKELRAEAKYYQLQDLVHLLSEQIEK